MATKIKNRETGEIVEIRVINPDTGNEWSRELIDMGLNGLTIRNDHECDYEANTETVNWWVDYCSRYETADRKLYAALHETEASNADHTLEYSRIYNAEFDDLPEVINWAAEEILSKHALKGDRKGETKMKSEIEKLETAIKPNEKNSINGGTQLIYDFKNGYGASVIFHDFSYGNKSGLLELAVLKNGDLCYDSGITDDVIGFINCEEAKNYISQIKELESPKIVSEKENRSIKVKLKIS